VKWLSPKSVAEILDVDRSTAYRMMRDGRLPGFELQPGMWRVSEDAMIKLVRKKERKAYTPPQSISAENNGEKGGHWPDTPVTSESLS